MVWCKLSIARGKWEERGGGREARRAGCEVEGWQEGAREGAASEELTALAWGVAWVARCRWGGPPGLGSWRARTRRGPAGRARRPGRRRRGAPGEQRSAPGGQQVTWVGQEGASSGGTRLIVATGTRGLVANHIKTLLIVL